MKKGEVYDGMVERVAFPNKGFVTVDGQSVVVKNTIPGQRVEFRVNKKKGTRMEGRLLSVLEASPLETSEPMCSQFPACGGCLYQTMDYSAQLRMKAEQVRELLERQVTGSGKTWEALFEGVLTAPNHLRYRNKMEYAFGDCEKGGPLTLGLHKKNSNFDILPAADCVLVHEDFNRIVRCAQAFFRARGLSHWHRLTHEGFLRHLLVRRAEATGEILVGLVTASVPEERMATAAHSGAKATDRAVPAAGQAEAVSRMREEFVEALTGLKLDGSIVGILHTVNDALSDIIRDDGTTLLYGRDYFYEVLLGLKFKISPFSFFQTN